MYINLHSSLLPFYRKRRVTVGEMILDSNCKYVCLENITDGLSSTDSVKLIQDLANVSCLILIIICVYTLFPLEIHTHIIRSINLQPNIRHVMRGIIQRSSPYSNQVMIWLNYLINY